MQKLSLIGTYTLYIIAILFVLFLIVFGLYKGYKNRTKVWSFIKTCLKFGFKYSPHVALVIILGWMGWTYFKAYKMNLFTSGQQNILFQIANGVKEKPVEMSVNVSQNPSVPELVNVVCEQKKEEAIK